MSSLGYDAMVLNRIPDPLKQHLKTTRQLEFVWQGVPGAAHNASLLAHVLDSHYSSPKLNGSTVPELAASFVAIVKERAAWYATPQVLIPWGNDFAYTTPQLFDEMDGIMAYLREHPVPGLSLKYSTLTSYFDALATSAEAEGLKFPLLDGEDLFPYIACVPTSSAPCTPGVATGSADAFWSGYFSGKPVQKLASFRQTASLRLAEALVALSPMATLPAGVSKALALASNTSGLMQHHDAMPGTSFNYCTISATQCDCFDDYNRRIADALNATTHAIGQVVAQSLSIDSSSLQGDGPSAFLALQRAAEGAVLPVVVTNALATAMDGAVVRAKVASGPTATVWGENYVVTDASGKEIQSQLVRDYAREEATLVFAVTLGPLSSMTYFVSESSFATEAESHGVERHDSSVFTIQNDQLRLMFDETGSLVSWSNASTVNATEHTLSSTILSYQDKLPPSGGNM